MSIEKGFRERVEELAAVGRPRIAFGLLEKDPEILESLERSKQYADIALVGPHAIEGVQGFEKILDDNPEERLASMLANDEVAGIVRGTIDDFKTIEAYQRLTNEKEIINPALMESPRGQLFFLSPASNPEGWEKEERLLIAISRASSEAGVWNHASQCTPESVM